MNATGKKKSVFPWSWLVSGFALLVIILTLVCPAPGEDDESEGKEETNESEKTIETEDAMSPDTIRIRILNGTSEDNLAANTADDLRGRRDSLFLIGPEIETDNAAFKTYSETIVVSHILDLSAAKYIAHCLGLTDSSVVWEIPVDSPPDSIDVTIYLGEKN